MGVAESRRGVRFALETLPFGLGSEGLREHLDSYVAIQPRIPRPIYLTHSTLADGCQDLVGPEPRACREHDYQVYSGGSSNATSTGKVLLGTGSALPIRLSVWTGS